MQIIDDVEVIEKENPPEMRISVNVKSKTDLKEKCF